MSIVIIILVIISYFVKSKFIKSDNSTNRFIGLFLLIVTIWSIQDLIKPDSCKCEENSLFFASIISLVLFVTLDKIIKLRN